MNLFKLFKNYNGAGESTTKIEEYIEENDHKNDIYSSIFRNSLELTPVGVSNNCIYYNTFIEYYICSIRDLCNNIPIWAYNRKLNHEHIAQLEKDIIKDKHFIGSVKIMKDNDDKYCIFDGQHRINAIKNIMKTNSKFDMDVLVELYKVDNMNSNEAILLFKRANNVKNVEFSDTPNELVCQIINKLILEYPGMIIDVANKRINRPRIDKQVLYQKLLEVITNTANDTTANTVVENIIQINNKYGMYSFDIYKKFGVSLGIYKKAQQNGFYLGLDNLQWVTSL